MSTATTKPRRQAIPSVARPEPSGKDNDDQYDWFWFVAGGIAAAYVLKKLNEAMEESAEEWTREVDDYFLPRI